MNIIIRNLAQSPHFDIITSPLDFICGSPIHCIFSRKQYICFFKKCLLDILQYDVNNMA